MILKSNFFNDYPIIAIDEAQKKYIARLNYKLSIGEISLEETCCELCRTKEKRVLFENDRHGLNYKTVICNTCGLIYSSPRFSEKSNSEFYQSDIYRFIYGGGDFIDSFEKKYSEAKNYRFSPVDDNYRKFCLIDFLFESKIDIKTICEFGAGGGTNLIPLIDKGFDCTGYEYGTKLVDFGKSRGINMVQGGLEDLYGTYDLIIMCHVLEHFLSPIGNLKFIRDNIKRYLLIEVPCIISRIPSIQNAHQYYFSQNTLLKVLSLAGFTCLKHKVFKAENIIIALFEKDNNAKFDYDFNNELKNSLHIVNKGKIRFLGKKILKRIKLNFF